MSAKMKTNDPQITVTGRLKQGRQGELITFSVRLAFFELVAIVNIPAEGELTAPCYLKFKVRNPDDDAARGKHDNSKDDESQEAEAA